MPSAAASNSSTSPPAPVMRAFTIRAYGNASDILTLSSTHPQPVLTSSSSSSTSIIIRVHAASINPGDYRMSRGDFSWLMKKSFPYIPGFDCSGVVIAIGSKVSRVRVGDAVFGNLAMSGGSFADYVLADESHVALKPKNMTFEQAASIPGLGCPRTRLYIHMPRF
jgi:NADPH:quinone reductase-like Zn-dependent oxidoreductase